MYYLLIAIIMAFSNHLHAATYSDPVAMFDIPELKLDSYLKFTNNYMYRGATMSNDQGAVQGGFDVTYGDNVNILVQGSSVNYGTATMELIIAPKISNNFGLDWLKFSAQYLHKTYPNYSDQMKNYFNAYHRFYYNNFTPYIKMSKQINGNKIQYTEAGLKYKYSDYFLKVSYSKENSKIASTEETSELNGKNTEISIGYIWKHYKLTLATNRYRKDAYTGGTPSTTKTSWASITYNS